MKIPTLTILPLVLVAATAGAQKTVQVVRPIRTQLEQHAGLPGTLIPEEQLRLQARVTGYLAEIPVDHGSEVRGGDLLARIAAPDLDAAAARARAAVAEAEAAVGDAEAAVEVARSDVARARAGLAVCKVDVELAEVVAARTRALVEKRGATPEELDEAEGRLAMAAARGEMAGAAAAAAESRVQAAEAAIRSAAARLESRRTELEAASVLLEFTSLTCPFERAVVTRRRVDPGALVRMDETVILELARVDRLRAEFHVPERDAVHVEAGTPVDLRIDAVPGEPLQARVTRTGRSLTSSRVMIVQVDLDNEAGRLLPGMFVYGNLVLSVDEGALTLPAAALRNDGDGSQHVLVAVEGMARKVPVRIGADNGIRVEVREGLTGNEAVIVAGAAAAGEAVRVVEGSR